MKTVYLYIKKKKGCHNCDVTLHTHHEIPWLPLPQSEWCQSPAGFCLHMACVLVSWTISDILPCKAEAWQSQCQEQSSVQMRNPIPVTILGSVFNCSWMQVKFLKWFLVVPLWSQMSPRQCVLLQLCVWRSSIRSGLYVCVCTCVHMFLYVNTQTNGPDWNPNTGPGRWSMLSTIIGWSAQASCGLSLIDHKTCDTRVNPRKGSQSPRLKVVTVKLKRPTC